MSAQAQAALPRAGALRLVGPAAARAKGRIAPPFGAKFTADAEARAVALGPSDAADVGSVARALPDPDTLPGGALCVVLPGVVGPPSLGSRFLAVLGRGPTVPRVVRATALVARGYVDVAAGVDGETRADLVWGYAPPEREPSPPAERRRY